MKFKVGDKVECVASGNGINGIGDTGVIVGLSETMVMVKWSTGDPNYIFPKRLKLITSLPINITFNNKYEHQAVQQFLFDNGCKWAYNGKLIRDYGNDTINVDEGKKLYNNDDGFDNASTFTIADLDTIKEILNPSKPITEFKLNSEYTATIDPNTNIVKVGCQSFAFETIKELAGKL